MTANNNDGTPPQQTDVETPTNNDNPTKNTESNNDEDNASSSVLSQAHHRREYDLFVKLLCLGDSGVGKTSMLKRLVNDKFDNDFKATVGIDFYEKILDYDPKKQENYAVNNPSTTTKSMSTLAICLLFWSKYMVKLSLLSLN